MTSARHCPTCGTLGILPLDQPRDERGRIVDPVMLCPVCDREFRATGLTWLGAVEVPADWDELPEDEKMEVARGMAREMQRQSGFRPKEAE